MVPVLLAAGSAAAIDFSRFDTRPGPGRALATKVLEAFHGKDRKGKDGPMRKLGPDLINTYFELDDFKKRGGRAVLGRPFKSSDPLIRLKDETVVIDAAASNDVQVLKNQLIALGLQNGSVFGRTVSGYLPVDKLEVAAALNSLQFARPAYAMTQAGSVTSQGDVAMRSDIAWQSFNVDGSGILLGTLSDSYDCLGGAAGDVTSNDLPAGITVLQDETGCGSGTDEGRAMMQIIHDSAPGSSQAFHSAFNGTADFANGIVELATVAGADVINDDVIYFAEPMFQDGPIAQAVDTAKAMGVAYFSSAGNQARQSYEDTFRNSGQSGFFAGSVRHDFDPGAPVDGLQQVTIPVGSTVTFSFQWDDPFASVSGTPGADTDLDIILYSAGGTALAGGTSNNVGGDPVEVFTYTNSGPQTTFQLGLELFSGPAPTKIKYVYYGTMTVNQYATNSSTSYGHANAAGAQAVGAARYDRTPEFGVNPPLLESFSAAGGTPILFDTSGNPVNIVRQKPEIVAPDGVDTTFFGSDYEGNGDPNFFGTSAAAPHAAAVAALLKDLESSLVPNDIYSALQTTALDMGVAGVDFDSGYGLIQADAALTIFDSDIDTVPNSTDNCPDDANINQLDNDSDGEGDVCDADDDNDSLTDVQEQTIGTDPFNPDSDGDTLTDGDEVNVHATNPLSSDTDSDGFDDPVELQAGSDPLDNQSIPGSASGDINGDGVVDIRDILRGYRIVLGEVTPDTNEILRGDVAPFDGVNPQPNGLLDPGDLVVIERKVLGLISF